MSVQQHINKGIPRYQDYILNRYFNDSYKAGNGSSLFQCVSIMQVMSNQNLDCHPLDAHLFNCLSVTKSVWTEIVDKRTLEHEFDACSTLFGKKHPNSM